MNCSFEEANLLNQQFNGRLFKNANDFSFHIEKTAFDNKMTCIETLIGYCAERDIDYEDIANQVNDQLKSKLAFEFSQLGMLKKQSTIPDIDESDAC